MINMLKQDREEFCILGKKLLSNTCSFPKVQSLQILYKDVFLHPLLKGGYTGHEKTYSGDVDISPGLAETKRNQQFLEKSDLPIFLGSSRFFLN